MQQNVRTPTQLGAAVRRERRARGFTQAELGARINRRQATISKLENGEPATQLNTLFDVLAALDLELVIGERRQTSNKQIEQIF